jgi:hypothetical protein
MVEKVATALHADPPLLLQLKELLPQIEEAGDLKRLSRNPSRARRRCGRS